MATKSPNPQISDEAVEAKTGKTWSRWFKHLDAAGGKKMTHREIVAHLTDKHDVRPWWRQMVTATYEQSRGLRDKHQKLTGYEISVSRTIDAPVSKAFKAWTDAKARKRWLTADLTIRKATANKSLRISWEDGKTMLAVSFAETGAGRTQVVAQHGKLLDAKAAAKMKKFWTEALERLKAMLE